MKKSYINPLSANGQFTSIEHATEKISTLIEAIYHILPAVTAGRLSIIYDNQIEARSIISGQNILETLNSIKRTANGKDQVQKWFLFIKNHSTTKTSEALETKIYADDCNTSISGFASKDIIESQPGFLMSIGGSQITESTSITTQNEAGQLTSSNAHSLETLLPLIPCYEASDKHRKESYISQKGEKVSPMPLNEREAQKLLLTAVKEGSDYWAYHRQRKEFYRYKPTHNDRLIYHGFMIDEQDVPQDVIKKIRNP